jgi:hypothetical protein
MKTVSENCEEKFIFSHELNLRLMDSQQLKIMQGNVEHYVNLCFGDEMVDQQTKYFLPSLLSELILHWHLHSLFKQPT